MTSIKLENLSMAQYEDGVELWDGISIERYNNLESLIHALTFYQKHGELEYSALIEEHMYGDDEEEEK